MHHQFLATLTVQTITINPTPDADHAIGNLCDDLHPVVVIPRAAQHALELAGIDIATSCREGTCASCETPVLEGDVIHRDSVLSENERVESASMMVCVSRAKSGVLVLDL